MMHRYTVEIAKLLEKEERRRKSPFDHESRGLFWRCTLRAMASALRGLAGPDKDK
jgi:hypothetical protein